MAGGAARDREVVLETDRLLLRPWRVDEAAIQREMWIERDPRVPPHRRIDADGHPTVADFEKAIRADKPSSAGLLAVERKAEGDAIGYCGLVDSGHGAQEPELAFEFLRRFWGQGYAFEAVSATLGHGARAFGLRRVLAVVSPANQGSIRVLEKAGMRFERMHAMDPKEAEVRLYARDLSGA